METTNHEYYVSLEVAKLLEQVGFDWQDCFVAHYINEHFHWEIPLHIAQKWLREVKNCYVGVEVFVHNLDADNTYYTYNWVVYFNGNRYSGSDFDTSRYYEEALGAGIQICLTILLEELL